MNLSLVSNLAFYQRCHYISRADSVTCDTKGATFHTSCLCESDKTVLSRNVSGLIFGSYETVNGADVDDSSPALVCHVRPAVSCKKEWSCKHQADHEVPLIFREIWNGAYILKTSYVNYYVNCAVFFNSLVNNSFANFSLARVTGDVLLSKLFSSSFKLFFVNIGHHYLSTFSCKLLCYAIAYSASGACYNCNHLSCHNDSSFLFIRF